MNVSQLCNILTHLVSTGQGDMPVYWGQAPTGYEVQFVGLKGTRYGEDNTAVVLTDTELRITVDSDYRKAWMRLGGVMHHADRPEPAPDATWKQGLA